MLSAEQWIKTAFPSYADQSWTRSASRNSFSFNMSPWNKCGCKSNPTISSLGKNSSRSKRRSVCDCATRLTMGCSFVGFGIGLVDIAFGKRDNATRSSTMFHQGYIWFCHLKLAKDVISSIQRHRSKFTFFPFCLSQKESSKEKVKCRKPLDRGAARACLLTHDNAQWHCFYPTRW